MAGRRGRGPFAADDPFSELIHSHLVAAPEDEVRVARIADEARRAFRTLVGVRRAVCVFGSAKEVAISRWGALAERTAQLLAGEGFAVITGGGPGLMAAANAGAAGVSDSIGLTIRLPEPQPTNAHVTLEVPFHYFFLRKLAFVKYSCAFVCFPGGYGTLDEVFEALNLKRTHKLAPFPVLLVGSTYWGGLRDWLEGSALRTGCLSTDELEQLEIVDDPAVVVRRVVECHATLCRRLGIAESGHRSTGESLKIS